MMKVNEHALAKVIDYFSENASCIHCPFDEICQATSYEDCQNELYKILTGKSVDK